MKWFQFGLVTRKSSGVRRWNIAARIVVILPAFIGCGFGQATSTPSKEFTQVPPKNPGGPLTMGVITGRVNGPHEGLKLVLYARSERDHEWYVQPYFYQPFTNIQPDTSWNSATHLGTEYAAFLVEQGNAPPKMTEILPSVGRGVVAAAITAGTPPVWEKWWFRVLVLVVAISAILAFYRWRTQELTRQLNLRLKSGWLSEPASRRQFTTHCFRVSLALLCSCTS